MYIYILIAFVFGAVSSVIAYSKGRNSLGWFVAGLLIGPFALVIAVLPPATRTGQYIKCPTCSEVIKADASVCHYCRGDLAKVVQNEA